MNTVIALAGNPNTGKSAMFNLLTGARQQVGNYPGVTVEKKSGSAYINGLALTVVDLPGTYSLSAYSLEEVVARDFLVTEKPRAVVNIVDASNLERNLYLTVQFLELGIPVCMALNMSDVAEKRGISINVENLSRLLETPVVKTVARSGVGKKELLEACVGLIEKNPVRKPLLISYGADVDETLDLMETIINREGLLTGVYPARWTALKYLENDSCVREAGQKAGAAVSDELDRLAKHLSGHIADTTDADLETVISDHRWGFIRALIKRNMITRENDANRLYASDKLDKVLTDRFAGPLIMVAVILALYKFTFTVSEIPVAWVEGFFGWLGGVAEASIADGLLKSLVISGMIDGVGGVFGFVPLILFMFLGITFLEDTGYLARVAFMLDRVFRAFGLHGSSVMPFIVSGGIAGGCAVPGVMAARTIKSHRERLATVLTAPFMSCGAKMPVFALLIAAFFSDHKASMMLLVTSIAWGGALLSARLLRSTIIKGDATPFVMELPPYRLPTFKGLAIHTLERTWQYIKKAGTVILGISILLWAMMTFPGLPEKNAARFEAQRQAVIATLQAAAADEIENHKGETEFSQAATAAREQLFAIDAHEAGAALKNSVAGRIGSALEPLTIAAGFDWRTNIALLGGFAAKEVVVSTLGTAYSLGEVDPEETGSLSEILAKAPGWSPATALALIIFTIFYAPCFVAVVCIAREAGSWKWGAFSMVFNTALAFLLAVTVYQVGRLFSL